MLASRDVRVGRNGRTQDFATLARREQTDNNAYMHGARRRAWRRAQDEPFIAIAVLQPGKAAVQGLKRL